eukprot:TRINITY_DN6855_c0_g1_i8.p1 TRINITY_DN6855_c0_g1~~TRINITY_DN6855_c0_g1_i8.p1  ORF type:complete len:326 (-),score=-5.81 TRINITY_DN6855_c0_g1_i8:310-1287(-)
MRRSSINQQQNNFEHQEVQHKMELYLSEGKDQVSPLEWQGQKYPQEQQPRQQQFNRLEGVMMQCEYQCDQISYCHEAVERQLAMFQGLNSRRLATQGNCKNLINGDLVQPRTRVHSQNAYYINNQYNIYDNGYKITKQHNNNYLNTSYKRYPHNYNDHTNTQNQDFDKNRIFSGMYNENISKAQQCNKLSTIDINNMNIMQKRCTNNYFINDQYNANYLNQRNDNVIEKNSSISCNINKYSNINHVQNDVHTQNTQQGLQSTNVQGVTMPQECVICMQNERNAGFGHDDSVHKCVCKECAAHFKVGQQCPLCRKKIQLIITKFYA